MRRSESEIREALQRLIDAAWHKPKTVACFTIPVDTKRDADIILADAIDELMKLREMYGAG